MNKPNPDKSPPLEKERQPLEPPRLFRYGTLSQITQGMGGHKGDGHGMMMSRARIGPSPATGSNQLFAGHPLSVSCKKRLHLSGSSVVNKAREDPTKAPPKKEFDPPCLTRYGNLAELTQGMGGHKGDGHGSMSRP